MTDWTIRAGLALLIAAGSAQAGPRFAPIAAPDHVYDGGWEHFVGGGLAAFDCDGDHLPELYAAGGSNPAKLLRNRSTNATLEFEAATPDALALTGVIGAYPLDIDGDGHLDLMILRVGENRLLRGGPDCSFAAFAAHDLPTGDRWTTAFSATWEEGQSLPTLAFGHYVDRSNPDGPFEACDINHLFRPDGDSYRPAMVLEPGFCPLSMLFSDWSGTGRADLRISNDRHYYVKGGEEQLWAMEANPRLFTQADGWQSHQLWGMGIAARDITGDGRQEVFLTSMADQRLQVLAPGGAPRFEDVPYEWGTTAHRPYTGGDGRPATGWHVQFGDVQNDGRDDVFITKGNVQQMPGSAMDDPNNLLIQTDAGFVEAGLEAGLASMHRGRGAVFADLNGDGLLDVAVINRRAPLEIWQNVTDTTGTWLAVTLDQPAPNRRAVGAFIEVDTGQRVYLREITIGGGHAGGSALPAHFGLGDAETVRLRIRWPQGGWSDWMDTQTNQRIRISPQGEITAY
ncbi:MAG: CRTAC1 family protein [Rhodobacteraceae bacterium]|nr:CRTAC1 family protein [Paracoccaceae bacterium]